MSPQSSLKKVLVVGGGSIGERHLRCFLETGRTEVAICEPNDTVRTRLAESYDVTDAFDSFAEAVRHSFEIVVICTPAPLHIEMALASVERGASILVEKPLSTALDGVDALVDAVNASGVHASVAYVYRAHPALFAMRQAIRGGRFGQPVEVVINSGQHFPFYRPAYRETYYTRHETGGGAIQDALTHVANAVEWLVGPITSVAADAEHCVLEGVSVEDTVHVIARHGSILSNFSLNQHQAPNESTITVNCEGGTARFEMHRHRWMSMTEPGGDWHIEQACRLERDDLFIAQANQFLDCHAGEAKPACPLEEGAQTLRVNLAILQAARERRWIDLDKEFM